MLPEELAGLWKRQRGKCALTGRKLGRDAHLDHIIPVSRGGECTINNLRWVCPEVNFIRGYLVDEEFVRLCRDVIAWSERTIVNAKVVYP